MNNPTSLTINLIFFFSVIIGRALYLFHIEKNFGSSKDEIIGKIKKDIFVLIPLILIIVFLILTTVIINGGI